MDDKEISSWLGKIISNQSKETSSIDISSKESKEKETNNFLLDDDDDDNDFKDDDDLDLNFFKKYRKQNAMQLNEKEESDDDVDISHFFHLNEPIEIENEKDTYNYNKTNVTENYEDIDTLNEARRLLSSWADQTESFQAQGKQANPNPININYNNQNSSSPNRVVKYRKLEMPMMVAKKAPDLKVNDPTLKMEERLKHVREMREKRLEKQKLKQIQTNSPQRENNRPKMSLKVPVPDIDSEIRSYRSRMNDNLREKQKEIEEREKRMRRIESEAFSNVQADFYSNSRNNTESKSETRREKARPNTSSNISINRKSSTQNQNQDNIRRTSQNNRNNTNELSINTTTKSNKSNATKNNADDDMIDERVIQMRLQVFMKNEIIRRKRYFFAQWVDRCRFQTQTFKKAAVLANFRSLSKFFSIWNKRLHSVQQKRELIQLETKLRERKSKEQLILAHFRKSRIRKFFSIWRIKYKTQVEFQIAEARKKKRLQIIALQINNNNNNNNQKNKNSNQKHQNNNNTEPVRKITVRHSTQPNHHFTKQENNQNLGDLIVTNSNQAHSNQHQFVIQNQNQNSPSNSPNRTNIQNAPKKVKKIKINPKIEAMEKRSEEQKQKRLEKLQKKVEEEKEMKEKQLKEEEEKLKKRRIEHLKELEKEKKIREEERKKQIESEKAKERLKYITEESEKFRAKMVKLNAFREWKKIIQIRKNFIEISNKFHSKKLKEKVMCSFQLNANMEENERSKIAGKFYTKHLKLNYFNLWFTFHENMKLKEKNVTSLHRKTVLKFYLKKMSFVRKERKKKRFVDIQNALRIETMRRIFKAWPIGCAAIREDEEREEERNKLLSKALRYLDEISSDEI